MNAISFRLPAGFLTSQFDLAERVLANAPSPERLLGLLLLADQLDTGGDGHSLTLPGAAREMLWAGRFKRRPLMDIARKCHIEPAAIIGLGAAALREFHEHFQAAFFDLVRVCETTDRLFGGPVVRSTAQWISWWRPVSRRDFPPFLIGLNIGIWGAAGSAFGLSLIWGR